MAVARRLREAMVEAAAPGAGDVRNHAVEHLAVAFVAVEPVVEIRAQEPAALRHAERERARDRRRRDRPGVCRRVFQHRDHVADRRGPEADDRRILRRVDDLVDLAGLELRRHIHARCIRNRFAFVVAREPPLAPRHDPARPLDRVAHGQHVVGRIGIEHGVGAMLAIGQRVIGFLLGHDEVAAHEPANRAAVLGRGRRIDADQTLPLRHVELPADPQQREALAHQEAVAHLGGRGRIEAAARVVEESEHAFAAAIGDLIEHRAVAAPDRLRLDHVEVGRELDLARRVSRRLVEIGHDAVRRQRRIHGEEDLSRQLLVRTGGAEGLAADEIAARLHIDADDLGERRRGGDQEQQDRACEGGEHVNLSVGSCSLRCRL